MTAPKKKRTRTRSFQTAPPLSFDRPSYEIPFAQWHEPELTIEMPQALPQTSLLDRLTSQSRKEHPVCSGFLDYFPDAIVEASRVSFLGNEKHNPGQPLHHARGKSNDHADCIARHLMQRGGFDELTLNGVTHRVRHSAALLWRAAALLQEELENEMGYKLPRNARTLK